MQFLRSSGTLGRSALVCCALLLGAALNCSGANGATIWDVSMGQRLTNSPSAGRNNQNFALFSPSGNFVLVGGGNGPYRIWYSGTLATRSRFPGEWSVRIGQNRYGIGHLKGFGNWPHGTFLFWGNNRAYPLPPALQAAILALFLVLLIAAASLLFRRKSENNKSYPHLPDQST